MTTLLNISMDKELSESIKKQAAKEDLTVSRFVRGVMREYISRKNGEGK